MPPSPQEIKSRLDKVVDQEGNVLDMASVLDIVSVLERIVITKEALEATRIGRVINLMRKKTENEELARRAKKLVKKWQKLVSNHFKNLSKSGELSKGGNSSKLAPSVAQLNGVVSEQEERPKSCTDIKQIIGTKRKRTSISAQSSPLSENDRVSLDSNSKDVVGVSNKTNLVGSNKTINSLVSEQNGQHSFLEKGQKDLVGSSMVVDGLMKSLDEATPHDQKDDIDWIAVDEDSSNVDAVLAPCESVAPEPPTDIPEEDLAVVRRNMPEDAVDPSSQADGVNGCYNEDGVWCAWLDCVTQRDSSLLILPYVILE